MGTSIIQLDHFISSTRDSGYKNLASALAELIDNAVEAGASKIQIRVDKFSSAIEEHFEVMVADNGKGMSEQELNVALQFGGSTRFNSRSQYGRYGMGLPNSTLSQCRRVEVISWKNRSAIYSSYLDVDEVVDQKVTELPTPRRIENTPSFASFKSGTVVFMKKCDRIPYKYIGSLLKQMHFELGKIFRHAIWNGVEISVGDEKVIPFDPLFLKHGLNLLGGIPFGRELIYRVKIPDRPRKISEVKVRFVELPVESWAPMTNEEKRRARITKNAGVSILRSGREIDYGWFFMGEKRKENYDDWWRCEISFLPELDEVFGVTHTKQEIKETEFMKAILVPDLEQTARTLNNRVRLKFLDLKKVHPTVHAKTQLERTDVYLPPLGNIRHWVPRKPDSVSAGGMQYRIKVGAIPTDHFFQVTENKTAILLTINENHLFYDKIFRSLHERKLFSTTDFLKVMEILIFAAARSELAYKGRASEEVIKEFKGMWSSNLKTLIS
ncbi:MAG TPA: ATP-binding protein [Flavisolibacter sp.]|nr:ATP-binding protein [Flavisolibacter sp.]